MRSTLSQPHNRQGIGSLTTLSLKMLRHSQKLVYGAVGLCRIDTAVVYRDTVAGIKHSLSGIVSTSTDLSKPVHLSLKW